MLFPPFLPPGSFCRLYFPAFQYGKNGCILLTGFLVFGSAAFCRLPHFIDGLLLFQSLLQMPKMTFSTSSLETRSEQFRRAFATRSSSVRTPFSAELRTVLEPSANPSATVVE